jgi:hypothetical protein
MSDKPEGPGWWIASDGKWYPPELHPSAGGESPAGAPAAPPTQPHRWQGQSSDNAHVGPQFPDLFQKAMQGSHLADNISVKYDGDDERNVQVPPVSTRMRVVATAGGGPSDGGGVVGATIGAPAKRKGRKGR